MTWSKEHEVVISATDTHTNRTTQLFNNVLTYHYETFLPAHGVTTAVDPFVSTTPSASYAQKSWQCKRTIVPTGRPNLASYEKAWMDHFRFYNPSVSSNVQYSFTWDGTNNNPLAQGSTMNDSYRAVFGAARDPLTNFPSGELRYKWYVSSEDTNTWLLFFNGYIIGMEIGDDVWWREPGLDFMTVSFNFLLRGQHCLFPGSYENYSSPATFEWGNNISMGLPMSTSSYTPNASPTNFLITDNIYYYVTNRGNSGQYAPGTLTRPYIIGKNRRTDILLKIRDSASLEVTSHGAAQTIVYNGNYYIDTNPTGSSSMLLATTTDEGVL